MRVELKHALSLAVGNRGERDRGVLGSGRADAHDPAREVSAIQPPDLALLHPIREPLGTFRRAHGRFGVRSRGLERGRRSRGRSASRQKHRGHHHHHQMSHFNSFS
ncbi:hypothetical protein D3C72_2151270 [compost metagenome]